MVTAQDIAHRNFVDAMPQVCQGPLDATVTPRRVLLRHAYDDLFDCLYVQPATRYTMTAQTDAARSFLVIGIAIVPVAR